MRSGKAKINYWNLKVEATTLLTNTEDVKSGVKAQLRDRVFRKLKLIDYAISLKDLQAPLSNNLHSLSGKRKWQWSIAVNGPWRLCFYFKDSEASEVELLQYN